nr:hypothetical protein [Tanacetum cinerariifolium]
MKDFVANKPWTEEDKEIRMNPRCSALLQNQLSPKEQDPGSFILPCSIGRLDFNNALVDLGASISVMPLSMYKCLGIGKLKPINMVIKMDDNTKCTPKGIVENLLIKIDKFVFPLGFVILDIVKDFRMPIILGRPFLATAHAKAILQENKNEHQYWASCDLNSNICDGGGVLINEEKRYLESINDSEQEELKWEEISLNDWIKIRHGRICKMTRERILKDHWREKFGDEEDNIKENPKDSEECGEDKANTIMGAIHDKLNDDWFKGSHSKELEHEVFLTRCHVVNRFKMDDPNITLEEYIRLQAEKAQRRDFPAIVYNDASTSNENFFSNQLFIRMVFIREDCGGQGEEEWSKDVQWTLYWVTCKHFGLVSDEGLIGLTLIARELLVIDMDELVRLHICDRLGDTCAWVAPRLERQPTAVAGALEVAKGAPTIDEGVQVVPAPIQAPQPPPPTAQLLRLCLRGWHGSRRRFMGFERAWMSSMRATYTRYFETHVQYHRRRVKRRTDDASTSAAPHTADQPDP